MAIKLNDFLKSFSNKSIHNPFAPRRRSRRTSLDKTVAADVQTLEQRALLSYSYSGFVAPGPGAPTHSPQGYPIWY